MAGKLEIKSRIRSVDSTKKITKAMQLVAASKLTKCKNKMFENKEYASYLMETTKEIISNLHGIKHVYLRGDDEGKDLYIIFTSNMGLCGGYNANIFKAIEKLDASKVEIIMIGSRGITWLNKRDYNVIEKYYDIEEEDYDDMAEIANIAITKYLNKEVRSINVLYTNYKNAICYEPNIVQLLPAKIDKQETTISLMEFEPSKEKILDTLIPMYIKSLLFSFLLETKTSESASRRSAMESATDNAEELKEILELQYNQARQAAITQEISEIVGGANAL